MSYVPKIIGKENTPPTQAMPIQIQKILISKC